MERKKPSLRVSFGRVVAELRAQRGKSQEALAGEAGLHRTYVSLLERGLRSPTLDVVERIAIALNVSVRELVAMAERIGK